MNEQNMTRRKEVDLEITDFLWECKKLESYCNLSDNRSRFIMRLSVYKRQQECRYNSG